MGMVVAVNSEAGRGVRRLEFFVRTQLTATLPHPTYGLTVSAQPPDPYLFDNWHSQAYILGSLFQSSDTWLGSIVASFLASTSICKQDQNQSLLCPSPLNSSEHTWSRSPGKGRTGLSWDEELVPNYRQWARLCLATISCRTISIRYLAWWTF